MVRLTPRQTYTAPSDRLDNLAGQLKQLLTLRFIGSRGSPVGYAELTTKKHQNEQSVVRRAEVVCGHTLPSLRVVQGGQK